MPTLTDPAQPLEQLADRLRAGAVSISAATAAWLVLVEEFDRRRGWALPGVTSCAHWLSWQCGIAPGTARDHVRLARALPTLPAVAEQLRTGAISYAKARAVVRVADADTEAVLLRLAEHCTAAQLDRVAARWRRSDATQTANARARSETADQEARADALAGGASDEEATAAGREAAAAVWLAAWPDGADPDLPVPGWEQRFDWRDRGDGSVSLTLRLSAEDAAELVAAVEQRAEVLTRRDRVDRRSADRAEPSLDWSGWAAGDDLSEERRAGRGLDAAAVRRARVTVARTTALLDLVRSGAASVDSRPGDPARRELLVQVDAAVLADDSAAGQASIGEVAALSPADARRLACDAAVTTVLVDGAQVLGVGRARRFATTAQRRALLVRDGGCARPGCHETRPERLHAHHLVSWLAGGRTDVPNLVLLCDRCHGVVHDLGLVLRRDADGRLVARSSEDEPVWAVPEPPGTAPAPPPTDGLPASWQANGERLAVRYALGVLLDNRAVLRRRLHGDQAASEAA